MSIEKPGKDTGEAHLERMQRLLENGESLTEAEKKELAEQIYGKKNVPADRNTKKSVPEYIMRGARENEARNKPRADD